MPVLEEAQLWGKHVPTAARIRNCGTHRSYRAKTPQLVVLASTYYQHIYSAGLGGCCAGGVDLLNHVSC
jgi:hypothetical protein